MRRGKQHASKRTDGKIWPQGKTGRGAPLRGSEDYTWTIWHGRLVPPRGRPRKIKSLFKVVAEKLPFECIDAVKRHMKNHHLSSEGVYVAHDSMGYARYVGRGDIFTRLKSCLGRQVLELKYFSFYVVENKNHEREIETVLIRAAGPLLAFNDRKKNDSILPGNVKDYEAGTDFYERQDKKGAQKKHKKGPVSL